MYWYEPKAGDEHPRYWGQLCSSMHRLAFVREELAATATLSDLDQSLERLAYHIENYLVRIYELRERAAKLIATCARYQGSTGLLKGRDKRKHAVVALAVTQAAKDRYLELLDHLDEKTCSVKIKFKLPGFELFISMLLRPTVEPTQKEARCDYKAKA